MKTKTSYDAILKVLPTDLVSGWEAKCNHYNELIRKKDRFVDVYDIAILLSLAAVLFVCMYIGFDYSKATSGWSHLIALTFFIVCASIVTYMRCRKLYKIERELQALKKSLDTFVLETLIETAVLILTLEKRYRSCLKDGCSTENLFIVVDDLRKSSDYFKLLREASKSLGSSPGFDTKHVFDEARIRLGRKY